MKTYILLILLVCNTAQSQIPTYNLRAMYFQFTAANQLEWDIYIEHTNPPTIFEYAGGQYYFRIDSAISNGGVLTYTYNLDGDTLSDLPVNMRPRNPSVSLNKTFLRLAVNTYPGAGNGFIMTNNGLPGTRIVRVRLSTSATEFAQPLQLTWHSGIPNPYTKIFAYIGIVNTEISDAAHHFIDTTSINSHPVLINPPYNSINNPLTVNFVWKRVNAAVSYTLQVSSDSLFNNLIVNDSTLIDTFKIVGGFSKGTKYFWKVAVKDNLGMTYYSDGWKFTTIPGIKLNLKILSEGLYYPLFNQLSRRDTFSVYLRSATTPFSKVDSVKEVIDSLNFSGLFIFNNAPSGRYYIVAKHFNCIETWSKANGDSIAIDGSIYNYDFTSSISQAYGNNMKLKGGKYCIFSGDVVQDGFIDGSDFLIIDNDAFAFRSGRFIPSDLNGDNFVDAADMQIGDNNRSMIVITP